MNAAHCLIVVTICVEFHENQSKGIGVTEQTQSYEPGLCSFAYGLMVPSICVKFHGNLHEMGIWFKEWTKNATDGLTDRKTAKGHSYNIFSTPCRAIKNKK